MNLSRLRRLLLIVALVALLASAFGVSAQSSFTYVVRYGDTLAGIAARFGTTVQALVAANNIFNPNHIFAGQVLHIPAPPRPACGSTYVVRRGDTLAMIAAHCNRTVAQLVAANGIVNPNLIYAGQVLVIPAQLPPPTLIVTYAVQRGDYLALIASRFGSTVSAIVSYNNLRNPNVIYPGQVLQIPVYR